MTIEKMLPELIMLSVVIFAVVAWFKQLGAAGKTLTLIAFIFGLGLGVCYRYAVSPMADFASWFWAVIFGLLAGAIATGAYKAGQSITGQDK